jgi:hypothetical protein
MCRMREFSTSLSASVRSAQRAIRGKPTLPHADHGGKRKGEALGIPTAYRGAMIGHVDTEFTIPEGTPAKMKARCGHVPPARGSRGLMRRRDEC